MKWTTEPPTEPGNYWAKYGFQEYPVEVTINDGHAFYTRAGQKYWYNANFPVGIQFAGPIPEPEEAE